MSYLTFVKTAGKTTMDHQKFLAQIEKQIAVEEYKLKQKSSQNNDMKD